MKTTRFLIICLLAITTLQAQGNKADNQQDQALKSLIAKYAEARENQDTVLLKNILTEDIDQLVSNGVWRKGIRSAVEGMMNSSKSRPGERTLTPENVRFLNKKTAIVDTRYEIRNQDGSFRKMWSTFIIVKEAGTWKISAIRNMLPAN